MRILPSGVRPCGGHLGLPPLAVGLRAPGREIEEPMAAVILGGLLTSMILNLLVLPLLAGRYARFSTG